MLFYNYTLGGYAGKINYFKQNAKTIIIAIVMIIIFCQIRVVTMIPHYQRVIGVI